MAKVCRDLPFLKPFNLVSTGYRITGSGIQFKDLFRTELLNGLDQADVDGFGIGIFLDLRLPVLPPGKAFFQFIGTAPEHYIRVSIGEDWENERFLQVINSL